MTFGPTDVVLKSTSIDFLAAIRLSGIPLALTSNMA